MSVRCPILRRYPGALSPSLVEDLLATGDLGGLPPSSPTLPHPPPAPP